VSTFPASSFAFQPRRRALALGVAALLSFAGSPALAQDYPNKPIRLVIPFPAGGSSDGIGRQVADKLSGVLRQTVVVENKGGAGGIIGADAVAKAAPDGYTLVLVDVFHTSTPIYTRKMPYDAVKDFTPLSLVGRSPAFLVSHPGFEATSARDALAYGKAQPGKMTMAIAGTGSVVVDLFKARTGINFVSVPYRGSSPALVDLMSGQVNVMITTMASAGSHVKAGKLRPTSSGSASWARPACRNRWSTRSPPPWSRCWPCPTCASACKAWRCKSPPPGRPR
jgi:tripartite-type tricarboxylate transporter receptor subunit TctC